MQKANKNEVRKEIADLINRIKEQSDRIGKQREIPQSDVDLILYRIEELHKKTVVWAYLNELPVEVPGSETKVPVAEVVKPVAPPPAAVPEKKPEPVMEAPKIIDVPKTVEPAKEVALPKTGNSVPGTTENKERGTGNLKDVRTFIGINEKIMYIRQVFKGDDAAYSAAIEQFNTMNSWDEAQAFLSVLAGEYKWGKHDEPSEIFTQTIKRRFS